MPPAPAPPAARVLVVEDDPLLAPTMRRSLERAGYHVLQAGSGGDARRTLEAWRGRIDLVLTDLSLPDLYGEETWRSLRAADPSVPVAIVSGNVGNLPFVDEAPGVLCKPFDQRELVSFVERCLEAAGAREATAP